LPTRAKFRRSYADEEPKDRFYSEAAAMFRHTMFYFLVLCAAVGIPYLSSEMQKGGQSAAASPVATTGPVAETAATPTVPAPVIANAAGQANVAANQAISGMPPAAPATGLPPMVELAEAIRFDVTPPWVLGRWPRVTAGLPDADMQGYRVPLVSGTAEDDIAGSLTYYFNNRSQCVRITLQGTTGDARKLVALVTQRFGFKPQTSPEPGLYLYQVRWNGSALSELHIRPSRVVRANAPLSRFEVLLALNNPNPK
jgi:hypothetical protein